MRQKTKRLLSWLLVLCMVMGMLPATALAAKNEDVVRYTVLLLDRSGSMNGTPVTAMRQAAIKFCEQVLEADGTNYVAVVPFSNSNGAITEFTNDLDTLKTAIGNISATGGTNINSALLKADELLSAPEDTPKTIKNVLLLSDGLPESGASNTTGRYTEAYSSIMSYRYANVCYDTATSMKPKYTIYTLGFFHALSGKNLEFGQKFMYDLQNGGYYLVEDPDDLEFTFGEVADDIKNPDKIIEQRFSFPGQEKTDIEETCYYSDQYFFRDARDYKSDLATMSLCFELSSWAREDKSYNGSTTAGWTTDVTAENARFKNARDLLIGKDDVSGIDEEDQKYYTGLGFENFAVNDFWAARPTKDSIGAVAASKQLTDPDGAQYTLIALAIRGGGYQQEWASNFTVGKTGDHDGFAEARENVLDFLKSYISNYQISGAIKLWLVGYSRAGVTANMVAGKLDDNPGLLPNVTLAPEDLFAYTFEAPQGALRENFGNASNYENIHNIINLNDLVPLVAPSSWGFARYNKDQNLPSAFTDGANFGEAQGKMIEIYETIQDTEAYKIREYVTQSKLNIDWGAWFPGGDPMVSTEEYEVGTAQMLRDSTTFLFDGVVGGRDIYYYDFQAGVREILSLIYGGSLSDLLDEGITQEEFLERFFNELTLERLWEIVSPMVAINLDSFETRKEKVQNNIENFVKDVLNDSDLWGTVTFVAGLGDTLSDLLWRILESTLIDIWENKNTSTLQSVGNLAGLIAGGNLFQAHYAEVTLAWMMSRDKNYGGNSDQTQPNSYRIIHINCPVDVSVYKQGELVAQITDDQRVDIPASYVIAYVNAEGEKIVLLPANESYTISMQATGEGQVHYLVEEYDLDVMSVVRSLQYDAVDVDAGDVLTADVPAFSQQEQTGGIPDGSSAAYSLTDGETPVDYDDNRGTPVEYTVEVTSEAAETGATYGLVSGGGYYTEGSFAQVEAYPLTDSNFAGWYDESGSLVSLEETYRFAVNEDTTLVAHFYEVPTYQLTVQAQNGGSVANAYQIYVPEGVSVAVEASPDAGYEFAGWISTGGDFEDRLSPNTQFIMPAQDTVVTAAFNDRTSSQPSVPATYLITLSNKTTGGSVSIQPKRAERGQVVTITASPDSGYELDRLFATDKNGNKLELMDKGNGKYSFTMPASAVTVEASFQQIEVTSPVDIFLDVDPTAWYYNAVKYAVENGLMSGTGTYTFEPNTTLSRGMIAQMLYALEGKPSVSAGGYFNDVPATAWFAKAAAWAQSKGIITGYDNGNFGPNDPLTREQLALILYNYAKSKGYNTNTAGNLSQFIDGLSTSVWAQEGMAWAVGAGLLSGRDGNMLCPTGTATRAEVAQIMMNFCENVAK